MPRQTCQLVIHGGLGKTATSWIQQIALPALPVVQLGKCLGADGRESFTSDLLRKRQYQVFSPVYGPVPAWRRGDAPAKDIRTLAQIIVHQFGQACRQPNLQPRQLASYPIGVWSDETLLSYGGVESNIVRLRSLLTTIRDEWLDTYDLQLQIDVVLTIREQTSMIQSSYAYDFEYLQHYFPTFSDYLRGVLNQDELTIAHSLFYDRVSENLKESCPNDIGIRLVPYEILKTNGGAEYIGKILNLDAAKLEPHMRELGDIQVNMSSRASGYLLRKSSRQDVALQARTRSISGRLMRRLWNSPLLARAGKLGWKKNQEPDALPEIAVHSAEEVEQLQALYAPSNLRFQQKTGVLLRELGYAVQTSS